MNLSKEQNSVAWFVLAEFIRKGERERALGMHRLLMHNIENQAFCAQVEADLFAAFDWQSSVERYKLAAALYTKQNQPEQAAALYELLIWRAPHLTELILLLIQSYNRLNSTQRVAFFLTDFCTYLFRTEQTVIGAQVVCLSAVYLECPNSKDLLAQLVLAGQKEHSFNTIFKQLWEQHKHLAAVSMRESIENLL